MLLSVCTQTDKYYKQCYRKVSLTQHSQGSNFEQKLEHLSSSPFFYF